MDIPAERGVPSERDKGLLAGGCVYPVCLSIMESSWSVPRRKVYRRKGQHKRYRTLWHERSVVGWHLRVVNVDLETHAVALHRGLCIGGISEGKRPQHGNLGKQNHLYYPNTGMDCGMDCDLLTRNASIILKMCYGKFSDGVHSRFRLHFRIDYCQMDEW